MQHTYKFVVTGAFNAGKTTFVNTVSDIATVNTDIRTASLKEQQTKSTTTVALDYGQITIRNTIRINLFGTPGQARFDFMREILAQGIDGLIFVVDASDTHRLTEATQSLAQFRQLTDSPCIIAANKADIATLTTAELRQQLNPPESLLIVPCVATDKSSTQSVVEQMVALVEVG